MARLRASTMPDIESRAWAGPPRRPNGIYVPRFRNVKEKSTNGFIRGYGYQGGSSPNFNFGAPGFGESYKNAVRDTGNWGINLGLWGECLARKENYVEIDNGRVDAWGIPTLKVNMEWSDNEKALWKDGREQAAVMLEAAALRMSALPALTRSPAFASTRSARCAWARIAGRAC